MQAVCTWKHTELNVSISELVEMPQKTVSSFIYLYLSVCFQLSCRQIIAYNSIPKISPFNFKSLCGLSGLAPGLFQC